MHVNATARRRGAPVRVAIRVAATAIAWSLVLLLLAPRPAPAQDDGEVPDYVAVKVSTDRPTYAPGEVAQVTVEMKIDPRVHINAHVPTEDYQFPTDMEWGESPGLDVGDVAWPKAILKAFEFTEGAKIAVLEGTQKATVPVKILAGTTPGTLTLKGTFRAQGCTHTTCYAPQFDEVELKIAVAGASSAPGQPSQPSPSETPGAAGVATPPATESATETAPASGDTSTSSVASEPVATETTAADPSTTAPSTAPAPDGEGSQKDFHCPVEVKGAGDKPLLWVFLASYMGGILLTFTPCVLPLVPITIGIFARQRAKGGRPIVPALMYVLGLAVVYAALGTSAALTGNLFGAALQNKWVLVAISALLFALALSMFGLWNLDMPASLRNRIGGFKTGPVGPMLMGGAMGIVAAPCVGPFVVSLLTYVANLGATMSPAKAAFIGGSLFFVLATGLGTPFFLVALGAGSIRPGEWMDAVKRVFGFIIFGVVLWFLRPVFGDHGAAVFQWGLALVLLSAAVYFFVTARGAAHGPKLEMAHRVLGVLCVAATIGLGAVAMRGGQHAEEAADGFVPYTDQAVEQARAEGEGRPVVIDFGAAWCIACKELEHQTFPAPEVLAAGKDFVLLRADLTDEGSQAVKDLRARYKVRGLPTVIFLDRKGREITSLRLTGFEGPDSFAMRLKCAGAYEVAAGDDTP